MNLAVLELKITYDPDSLAGKAATDQLRITAEHAFWQNHEILDFVWETRDPGPDELASLENLQKYDPRKRKSA